MMHDPHENPNLLTQVRHWMTCAKQPINQANAQCATLYIGLCFEELGEVVAAVATGCLTDSERLHLLDLADLLKNVGVKFKSGMHMGDVLRADQENLLQELLDLSVVSTGGAAAISTDVAGALRELCRANSDKFPNGEAILDANGKFLKPHGWRAPDMSPFVRKS